MRPPTAGDAPYDVSDPVTNLERQALKLALQHPGLCGPPFDALATEDFRVPMHAAVLGLIAGCGGVANARSSVREWVAQVIDAAPDAAVREFVTRLAVEPIEVPRADGEPDVRYAEAVLAQLEQLAVSRRISQLKSRLQRLNPTETQPDYNRVFAELVALEQRRRALLEKTVGAF